MAILSENIARRANREDACRGRFWETRFRCRECADPGAILLCGIHVDLNPIKAGAKRMEASQLKGAAASRRVFK